MLPGIQAKWLTQKRVRSRHPSEDPEKTVCLKQSRDWLPHSLTFSYSTLSAQELTVLCIQAVLRVDHAMGNGVLSLLRRVPASERSSRALPHDKRGRASRVRSGWEPGFWLIKSQEKGGAS